MVKTAALIRTHKFGQDEIALKAALSSCFGANIFFVIENFHDSPGRTPPDDAGPSFVMTPSFLAEHGLARFHKAGWQCGDYTYYAGATQFPEFDVYWVIEPDVHFTFQDVSDFFGKFLAIETQFLGFEFGARTSRWAWHESMNGIVDGQVYGVPFALTRMARPAALHLLEQRAAYCRSDSVRRVLAQEKRSNFFANDEAFVASILRRDGFSCGSLEDIAGTDVISAASFSTHIPVMPQELHMPDNRNKVFHPVCGMTAARGKLARLMQRQPLLFKQNMERLIGRHGAQAWQAWSGMSVEEAKSQAPGRN